MFDYVELSSSPYNENCVAVSKKGDYIPAMKVELARYKAMLEKRFPIPEGVNANFRVKWSNHDFGMYGEVAIQFDNDDPMSTAFAYFVDENVPADWDDESVIVFNPEEEKSKEYAY